MHLVRSLNGVIYIDELELVSDFINVQPPGLIS